MKIGTKIIAVHDIQFADAVIKTGTIGKVSRVSPRLKETYKNMELDSSIVLKFPKIPAFIGMKYEVRPI